MTGNQDRAQRAAEWAADLQGLLMPVIDRSVAVLLDTVPAKGDVAAAEKQARAVGVIARSARAASSVVIPKYW